MACELPSANVEFEAPSLNADPCNFQFSFPRFGFGFVLPSISFAIPFPTIKLSLELSCSLDNPIDVSGGLSFGGGRIPCFDPDPDDAED